VLITVARGNVDGPGCCSTSRVATPEVPSAVAAASPAAPAPTITTSKVSMKVSNPSSLFLHDSMLFGIQTVK
jgi:hypothetical protein